MVDLNHIALCAGIGGDTLAANWAGFTTVQLVEKNPIRQAVLRKHWPEVLIEEDINDFKGEQYRGKITLITAGDPCQPSSLAGKRKGAEDDRYLWPQVFRVLCEVRPTWFVGENPPGRITMDFYRVLSDLEGQGYETRPFIIPACAVNAPHRRDRLYIVAYNDEYRQPRARIPVPERRPQQAEVDPRRGRKVVADASKLGQPQPELRGTPPCTKGREVSEIEPLPLAVGENPCSNSPGQRFQADCQEPAGGDKTYSGWDESWVETAAALCRVDDGLPNRVARLEALGDSQVPQQLFPILWGIAEIERGT